MIRFCFGVLLQILQLCSPRKTTQKFLCGTMFLSVNQYYDIREEDTIVGHLKDCTREISSDVTNEIDNVDPTAICACFENEIIPRLSPDEVKLAIGSLAYIVAHAENIDEGVPIGTLKKTVKSDYLSIGKIEPAVFFTDLFIFSVKAIENSAGKLYIGSVTKDYLRCLPISISAIELVEAKKDYSPILSSTIRSRNFDKAFEEVTSSKLGLANPNDLRFFRLRSEDYEFDDVRLRRFLTDNIGRYLYSRAQIEKFYKEENEENISLEAAQYIRDHLSGNEFGAIMVYSFLEEILDAPKLLSRIELGTGMGVSDGIHLKRLEGQLQYQLVYGASDIQGDLRGAIDAALVRVADIKKNKPSPFQIIDNTSFETTVEGTEMANGIRRILLPRKKDDDPPATAFGIFLGYTLKMNEADYSLPVRQFKKKMAERMEQDITGYAAYIKTQLEKLGLHHHSYYVYVLPLNDANEDKHKIIGRLIGGGVG